MSDTANQTSVVVEKIDQMVEAGNLTTRSGLSLVITVFREGMLIVGSMEKRMQDLETAYIRFTNTMSEARDAEEENRKTFEGLRKTLSEDIMPTMKILKWIGGILTAVIIAIVIAWLTGKLK